ncbi:MAG: hypothetical protein HQL95_02485 [Magnetococcales bacterium]|nr:hypothetical protein [Magnetococcales bacterium]
MKSTLTLLSVFGWLFSVTPAAANDCLIGFDVGSSGLRAGSLTSDKTAKVKVDYLADLWPDNRIDVTTDSSVAAFKKLPEEIGMKGCLSLAGGYSAWRLAMEKGKPGDVARSLAEFHQRTGVYFFVIPQDVEGAYGYAAARQAMGEHLTTPFIIDIGGGSLQIASQQDGWGAPLGQKSWRKLFCEQVKHSTDANCPPNPAGKEAVEKSRQTLAPFVSQAIKKLGQGLAITAVSPLVVHGMHPVMRILAEKNPGMAAGVDARGFSRAALAAAIALLADKDDPQILKALANCRREDGKPTCQEQFVATFVSDMLLLHALMEGMQIDRIEVGEADITNVPGILADPRPKAWSQHYACYLTRLESQGIAAFTSDPGTCPPEP